MSQAEAGLSELALGLWPTLVCPPATDGSRTEDLNDPRRLLDALPAALYVTDAEGRITYFNDAAAELWGRRPRGNTERWCGSSKLFRLDGAPLPHEQGPLAMTLKDGIAHRGKAILERPDGTAYPSWPFQRLFTIGRERLSER